MEGAIFAVLVLILAVFLLGSDAVWMLLELAVRLGAVLILGAALLFAIVVGIRLLS